LRTRLAPVRDRRVAAALGTSVLAFAGLFTVYSYISVVFHRATGGNGRTLAVLLFVWGVAATAGNLGAGQLADRFGGRAVVRVALIVALLDFALMPWTSATLAGATAVLVAWGLSGWGLLVAQQQRLVNMAPEAAAVLIALNSAAVYIAVSASGVIGAAALGWISGTWLGLVAAAFIAAGLLVTELARPTRRRTVPSGRSGPVHPGRQHVGTPGSWLSGDVK
jgi:predicted MFS family arabinose efflux permease